MAVVGSGQIVTFAQAKNDRNMFNFFNKPKSPAELPFATDIHCHVIPGVDDGSPDIATSVELIERMQSWGIKRIFASPHVTKDRFENTAAGLDEAMNALQSELDRRGNGIKLVHHAEYRLDEYSLSFFESGEVMTLPGNYIMIENPFVSEAWFIDNTIFDLQVKGFVPVLAHPERYSYYYKNRARYSQLHAAGAKFQINLLSLAEAYGKEQREVAEQLIADGIVDFIGTDLHNSVHADRIERYLLTRQARTHFASIAGKLLNDKIQ